MRNQVLEITKENQVLKETVTNHEGRLVTLEKKNIKQESTDRNQNILIYGVKGNNYGEILSKIVEVLQSLIPEINKYAIKNVIKMNKEGWNAEGPIKIYLISNLLKNDIMRAKYKLQDNSIRITEDLSKENREIRKKLVPYSLEEKNKGNKVFMKRETLVINGKAWTLCDLENRGKNQMETDSTSHTGEKATTSTIAGGHGLKRAATMNVTTPTSAKRNKVIKDGTLTQKNLNEMWNKQLPTEASLIPQTTNNLDSPK